MATRKPTPKPAPKPVRKPAPKPAPKTKPAPIPEERPLPPTPTPKPAPLDLVRNPNFDSAIAQQNYQNSLAEQRARIDAERGQFTQGRLMGAPSADPTAPPYVFDKSKERAGKEIILSFAGGEYGSVNDEAANAIAKKYNLEIVNKPNPNKEGGIKNYRFSVKGDVDKSLSGIKNEPGVKYAQPNFRMYTSDREPDPFFTYEDNRMRAALNGEELPTAPVGYVEGFDRSKKNIDYISPQDQLVDPQSPQGQAMEGYQQSLRNALSGYNPNAPSLMPIQTPGSDALNQDLANRGMGGGIPSPIPQGQQMQDYQNFLKQGMQNSNALNQGAMASFANTQPGMQVPQVPQAGVQIPQPGMQTPQPGIAKPQNPNMAGMVTRQRRQNPAQGKFSTFSNKPARFF